MPQMMPMMWSFMMMITLVMMMTLISLMYFIYLPLPQNYTPNYIKHTNWNWLW